MKWFSNLKTSVKLISCFILVALVSAIVGFISLTNINKLEQYDTILYNNATVPLSEVGEMNALYQQSQMYVRDMILENNTDKINLAYANIQQNISAIKNIMNSFKSKIARDEVQSLFEEFSSVLESYNNNVEKALDLCIKNRDREAYIFVTSEMRDSSDAVYNTLQEIVKLNLELAKEQFDQNKAIAETASITMSIAIVIAIVLAIALGIFVSNSIAKPLRHLVEVANQIAEGNLDVSVGISAKDEIGVLASAFDRMADNLNDLISSINLAAEQVAAGSRQLSESSFALSQGASEQASTIEQLTASLEEISTQTKQNADNSAEANNLAGMAKETALKGNKQMQDMMAAMDEIQKSSRNINNIIKVIDDIAFQTNILALNAAVEAARAGQHGRGFAVVADEVRNLASRSANAAKETTELIETSISNIERGTEIAKKTSDALDKIVEDVTKVASLVENIAVASKEQAAGISQINEGISLVSEVVQKNSATAEESASASEELSSQAQNLKDQIARFKLRQSDAETKTAVVPYPKVEKLPDIKPAEQRNGIDKHDEEDDNDTPEIILSDKEFDKY